MQLRKICEAV